ncbi:Hypothetical predicted protein [Xyrichtys novacula]|uniref:Uncharacterized protein n=1 Tax=Xyrichtys novacula TaxID=13765 RepID=A0AAV1F520_XYRNO|nr:Hypothetical predicted protein [Xyrichtys novacula]
MRCLRVSVQAGLTPDRLGPRPDRSSAALSSLPPGEVDQAATAEEEDEEEEEEEEALHSNSNCTDDAFREGGEDSLSSEKVSATGKTRTTPLEIVQCGSSEFQREKIVFLAHGPSFTHGILASEMIIYRLQTLT